MKKLNVDYDYVYIIDCLPQSQRDEHKISEELMAFLKTKGISSHKLSCNERKAVFEALDYLIKQANNGKKFLLQIVSHGTKDGLWIEDTNEDIYWCEFREKLQKIHEKTANTLLLNMTSCRGLNGVKIVSEGESDYPFFGLIGCARNLHFWEGKIVNELFYSGLLKNKDINEIISQIQHELKKKGTEDNVVYGITSEGYSIHKKRIRKK
ncbi:MAG: hypothetical protein LBH46_02460 [Rickettsiales bacterium]|jgi:hypothetical protein|nr:hypothetical protein [Rickettsiales bacterium]